MPNDKQEKDEWAVFDMNARTPDPTTQETRPRVHESRLGRPWRLRFDKPCYMPEAEARVFLKDPAFKVIDADGNHIPSLDKVQLERRLPERLDADFVIANVAELTTEALLTRAAQRAGGHKFSGATHRDVLIRFLTDGQLSADRAARPEAPAADGADGLEDMDEAATRRLLEGV